jgi:hypothetical protein
MVNPRATTEWMSLAPGTLVNMGHWLLAKQDMLPRKASMVSKDVLDDTGIIQHVRDMGVHLRDKHVIRHVDDKVFLFGDDDDSYEKYLL